MKKKASVKQDASAPTKSFPIVGIGASAGGLEAVTRLLNRLPADTGMAFVLIQHLDPAHPSQLAELLQRATSMKVVQALEGARVLPNRVYVIPPGAHMELRAGRLALKPRPAKAPAFSVDCFLESLARERGASCAAVILSGTASDGATGVRAIKAEGGVVFAQDEASAAHPGMPHSAVATGAVDFVLPPERIADELARLAAHPWLTAGRRFETPIDPSSLIRIMRRLRAVTGVDFGEYKPSTIQRRLARRLMLHKLSLTQYVAMLEANPEEAQALHDDLLIHVTHFYRDPAVWAALRARVFPRLLKNEGGDAPIRAWVAGCSSGEEAYSLAISLLDFLSERQSSRQVRIFATDISEGALERARAGVYPESIRDEVPERLLRRYFVKTDHGYEISKSVRDLCVFARHDLTRDPPFASLDLVSCRNVIIYFGPEIQRRVMPVFHYALKPWGALVLGKAETVGEFGGLFEAADKSSHIFFKKAGASRARFGPMPEAAPAPSGPAPRRAAPGAAPWIEADVQRVAERLLLARFSHPGVVVSADFRILHFLGKINRYLEPSAGKASLDLRRMLPERYASELKRLAAKAGKTDAAVRVEGLDGTDAGTPRVAMEVVPFKVPASGERCFIVLFEEQAERPAARASRPPRDAGTVRRLESELRAARTYLQGVVEEHDAAVEELKASNEEVVSANEELQSTNEELETAKEELQAANEELSTLNEELHARNDELSQRGADLSNLLSSVHLPIVMVSRDLRIRRFTQMAEKLMYLAPTDIGRPIGDVKLKMELPEIEGILLDVIETSTIKELEVKDAKGRAFVLRVRPYKTAENRVEGAVLVFVPRGEAWGQPPSPAK